MHISFLNIHMKRVSGSAIATILCLALTASVTPGAFGQATFGNITGTVTDPAGAAVPSAQIAITDTERGGSFQTATNGSGNYTQTHLLPGQYKIVINAPGFADFNVAAVVQVDTTTRADAQLQIGKASTEVTVSGESPLLKSDRAEVSTTITGRTGEVADSGPQRDIASDFAARRGPLFLGFRDVVG